LSSASGKRAQEIAEALHCDDQTVRNAIHAFHVKGVTALSPGSSRPHQIKRAITEPQVEQLKEMLHQSPRDFGLPTSLWTLPLAAKVAYEQGTIHQQGRWSASECYHHSFSGLGLSTTGPATDQSSCLDWGIDNIAKMWYYFSVFMHTCA
jgi:transposase